MIDTLNIERLTRVITILEALPPTQRFDLDIYQEADHQCGTSACAIGYAALDPWFNEQGLTTLAQVTDYFEDGEERLTSSNVTGVEAFNAFNAILKLDEDSSVEFDIYANGSNSQTALNNFFGMSMVFFDSHFTRSGYDVPTPTPTDVANKLRATLAAHHSLKGNTPA